MIYLCIFGRECVVQRLDKELRVRARGGITAPGCIAPEPWQMLMTHIL